MANSDTSRGLPGKKIDRRARKLFRKAIARFPKISTNRTDKSIDELKEALKITRGKYPRAKAWLAYALATAYKERLKGFRSRNVLNRALKLANEAVAERPNHRDPHWAQAFCRLAGDDPAGALKAYAEAVKHRPTLSLKVERAEAMIYNGDLKGGSKVIKDILDELDHDEIPDWFLWNAAWVLYFERKYDDALEHLDAVLSEPGDADHIEDMLLLEAAILAQKGDGSANRTLRKFLRQKRKWFGEDWTLRFEKESLCFSANAKAQKLQSHWLDGVKKAGLT